jgi:ABC-type transport system involved in cytochrome bd biosynthesis fused ATPase/permease subunit
MEILSKLTYLRGLSYTYPGCSEPALNNINFCLQAGETLAIVGYNGSGDYCYYYFTSIILFLTW